MTVVIWFVFMALSAAALTTGANGNWYIGNARSWPLCMTAAVAGLAGLAVAILTAPAVFD